MAEKDELGHPEWRVIIFTHIFGTHYMPKCVSYLVNKHLATGFSRSVNRFSIIVTALPRGFTHFYLLVHDCTVGAVDEQPAAAQYVADII
uniref:SFRICE_000251 n=1 Tax=Spodoptera frugiperda TaxID=7108 RepID=A0A2H1VN33_SPOFR